jgi:hypothetical protein
MELSIDTAVLFAYATTIINALWPIVGISAGFTLGFGILNMLLAAISRAVK